MNPNLINEQPKGGEKLPNQQHKSFTSPDCLVQIDLASLYSEVSSISETQISSLPDK